MKKVSLIINKYKKSLIVMSVMLIVLSGFFFLKMMDNKKELINKVSPIAKMFWDDSLVTSKIGFSTNFDVKTNLLSSDSTVAASSITKFAKQVNKKLKLDEFEFTLTSIDDSNKTVQITHGTYKGEDQIGFYTTIPNYIAKKSGKLNYKGTDDFVPNDELE